jgi:ligand-binding sensor domain-containing protein
VGQETWVATPAGVLRFDATLWSDPRRARPIGVIDVGAGLPATEVNDLLETPEGVLVATDNGLVQVGRGGAVEGAPLLAGHRVTALARGFAGAWDGLFRLGSAPRSEERVPGSERLSITALLACGGDLLVGTHDQGLLRYRAGKLAHVPGSPRTRIGGLSGCSGESGIAFASLSGVFLVEQGRATPIPVWRRHATAVLAVAGQMWIGTFGEGLLRLEQQRAVPALPPGRVSMIYRSPNGDLLVGTDEQLVVKRADELASPLPLDGPPPGMATALALQDGALWVGSFERGLGRLAGGRWEHHHLFEDRVTSLLTDPEGRLWVGTARGLVLRRGPGWSRVNDPLGWLGRHVSALRHDGRRLWVAVHPGLVVVDAEQEPPRFFYYGATGKEQDAGLVGPTVYGLAFSREGTWVGTDDGLSLMTPERTRSATDLGGVLPDNWVNDVRADAGALVVLTHHSGLVRVAPSGTEIWVTRFMTSPSALLLNGDSILFGTNDSGLAVATAAAGRRLIRTFGPAQGLASRMVTALLLDPARDQLWIGGSAGVDRVQGASRLNAMRREATP